MLRAAVPNGQLSAKQLCALALLCCKYDKGYFHITTRQNVQFNWISLGRAPNLGSALAKVGTPTSHTSGNCIRQITCDPNHEVGLDETGNASSLVRELRHQIVLNPKLERLPKKVKICVWASTKDNVLNLFHDIGIRLVGETAHVTLGGGLGRQPIVGTNLIKLRSQSLCRWLLAFLRIYCALSMTHKHNSRTKALARRLGKQVLIKLTKHEFEFGSCAKPSLPTNQLKTKLSFNNTIAWLRSRRFESWYTNNTRSHITRWLRQIDISSNTGSSPAGDVLAQEAIELSGLIQRWGMDQVRLSLNQTLVLPYVHALNATSAFAVCVKYLCKPIVCCPGLDYCVLANARSILVAQKLKLLKTKLRIRVSGCVNACSQHHAFDVGIVGINKSEAEGYQVLIGGCARAGKLARIASRAVKPHKIVGTVHKYHALTRLLAKDQFECAYACHARTHISFAKLT
ncbi:nitrite/sulfite reductase [Candidatus Hodgkinia cicadicola]